MLLASDGGCRNSALRLRQHPIKTERTEGTAKLKTLALQPALPAHRRAICRTDPNGPALSGGNDYWYEFVSTSVTWQDAFTAANAAPVHEHGRLPRPSPSATENTFIANPANGSLAWLGGSDAGNAINAWTWRNGPQAGQAFTYTNLERWRAQQLLRRPEDYLAYQLGGSRRLERSRRPGQQLPDERLRHRILGSTGTRT